MWALWIVVDLAYGDELSEKIETGTLHIFSCPCGMAYACDAPLLIFDRRRTHPLIYSPAADTSEEDDRNGASYLLYVLKDGLGSEWQERWIKNGLPWVRRHTLMMAFKNQRILTIAPNQKSVEHIRKPLIALASSSPTNWHNVVSEHPVLLTDETDDLLQFFLLRAQKGTPEFLRFHAVRDYLHTCRITGDPSIWSRIVELPLSSGRIGSLIRLASAPLADQQSELEKLESEGEADDQLASSLISGMRGRALGDFDQCGSATLEQKIQLLRAALSSRELQRFMPWTWKSFACELAHCYRVRKSGKREVNIRKAKELFLDVASGTSEYCYPRLCASALAGQAWIEINDSDTGSAREGISLASRALCIFSKGETPIEWADMQQAVGQGYDRMSDGGFGKYFCKAIDAFNAGVSACIPDSKIGARLNEKLGELYERKAQAGNLSAWKSAESFFEKAFATYGLLGDQCSQRRLAHCLATLLRDAPGQKSLNTQNALRYAKVATVNNRESSWPQLLEANLTYAYLLLQETGETATAAVETVIELCEGFLQSGNKTDRSGLGSLYNVLGIAYSRKTSGDQSDNIEQSIHHLTQSLKLTDRRISPKSWAATHHNLGNSWVRREAGMHSANIDRAVFHFRKALRVRTKKHSPWDWAATLNALGNAYQVRKTRGSAGKAVTAYTQALTVRRAATMPYQWATTLNGLSGALHDQKRTTADALQQSLRFGEMAMRCFKKYGYLVEWAKACIAISDIRRRLFKTTSDKALLKCIPARLNESRFVLTNANEVRYAQLATSQLGDYYFDNRQWRRAIKAYSQAIDLSEGSYGASHTHFGRMAVSGDIGRVFPNAAFALLQMGKIEEAIRLLDRGNAKRFQEAFSISAANNEISYTRRATIIKIATHIKKLEHKYHLATDPFSKETRNTSHKLRKARSTLTRLLEEANKVSSEVQVHGNDILLVPVVTDCGTKVCVCRGTGARNEVIDVPSFRRRDLLRILGRWIGAPELFDIVEDVCNELSKKLISPLFSSLNEPRGVPLTIIPNGALGLFPLHALHTDSGLLLSNHSVRFLPNRAAHGICLKRSLRPAPKNLKFLTFINPTRDLPHTESEGTLIAELVNQYSIKRFVNAEATIVEFRRHVCRANYLHFACHGKHNWWQPLLSKLILADRELFSADVLAADLSSARLVVLSACESGMTDVVTSEAEHFGLHTAFLEAGATGVISTLWPVFDFSSALLMRKFYQLHLTSDVTPVVALQKSQLWLRDVTSDELECLMREDIGRINIRDSGLLIKREYENVLAANKPRPFANPYHWAAFTYWGA